MPTSFPPEGAGVPNVMVPVVTFPPSMELGLRVRVVGGTTFMVSAADDVSLPRVAEIFAVAEVETTLVVTVKVAVVEPAAKVALAGTVAEAESEDSVTTVPPVGAALPSVIVPVELEPPFTVVGFRTTLDSFGGLTARMADLATVPSLAVTVALPAAVTGTVEMLKVAVVAPAATATVVGTVANAESEARFNANPPVGAGSLRVTVPTEVAPP